MVKKGLFNTIKNTPLSVFILIWLFSFVIFSIIYLLIGFEFSDGIYSSLLAGTIFGVGKAKLVGAAYLQYHWIIYAQLAISIFLLMVLIDKLYQTYLAGPHHHIHKQDKDIIATSLMLSMFRNEVDKIKNEFRVGKIKNLGVKDIEAVIDGLYVAFLNVENLFSEKNIHRHKIKGMHYIMMSENIEDSLDKLESLIELLEHHKIEWQDKHTEFWLKYIIDTADRISENSDVSHINNPKIAVALTNLKTYTQKIRTRLE